MGKDILSQVIEAEKDIQKCLDREGEEVQAWLKEVRKGCEQEYIREEQLIEASLERSTAEAAAEAEERAAGIVGAASRETERLGKVPTVALSRIVVKRIRRILPE